MLNYKTNRIALIVSAIVVVCLILFAILRDNANSITLREAEKILANHIVKDVTFTKKYVYLKTEHNFYKIASSQISPSMFIDYKVEVGTNSNIVIYILFTILFLGFGTLWFRGQNRRESTELKGVSKSLDNDTQPIQAIKSDVSFNDIGGISDVKVELEEIIDFMKNPLKYKQFGARMPKGVLLVGPPGVGKTMIAKAVANEANVPFYYQSGASFVQIYVGMGAKRVQELFSVAKKSSPSIIFIDEIDAVGKKRDGQRNDEREATLNQLLTEMDGFEGSSGIIVIAATNKIDVLDSALLRAGRFDRRVFVQLPTKIERESILEKYLQKIPHQLDVKEIANLTVGFNGASLATLVNEATLLSLREKSTTVTLEHFYQVKDKVMFGKKKLQILNEQQKKYRISYQAGKVVCASYYDLPFEKLMLSSEKLTPSTDEPLLKVELEARVKMLLAGMAVSNIKYNEHTSDSKYDLEEAKELVKTMLDKYGMGENLIPSKDSYEMVMQRLFDDTKSLMSKFLDVIEKVEIVLYEEESISKQDVKRYLDEVL